MLVLHERKTRLTPIARLAGKNAGETVAAMMAMLRRLDAPSGGARRTGRDYCP